MKSKIFIYHYFYIYRLWNHLLGLVYIEADNTPFGNMLQSQKSEVKYLYALTALSTLFTCRNLFLVSKPIHASKIILNYLSLNLFYLTPFFPDLQGIRGRSRHLHICFGQEAQAIEKDSIPSFCQFSLSSVLFPIYDFYYSDMHILLVIIIWIQFF